MTDESHNALAEAPGMAPSPVATTAQPVSETAHPASETAAPAVATAAPAVAAATTTAPPCIATEAAQEPQKMQALHLEQPPANTHDAPKNSAIAPTNSISQKCLRMSWRSIRFLWKCVFNKYVLWVLMFFLAIDIYVEKYGLPDFARNYICNSFQGDDGYITCSDIHVGIFNGAILEDFNAHLETEAGAIDFKAETVSCKLEMLPLLFKCGEISPVFATATGVSIRHADARASKDQPARPSIEIHNINLNTEIDAQDNWSTEVTGTIETVKFSFRFNCQNGKKWLKDLLQNIKLASLLPKPELSEQEKEERKRTLLGINDTLVEIKNDLSYFLPHNSACSISLNYQGNCAQWPRPDIFFAKDSSDDINITHFGHCLINSTFKTSIKMFGAHFNELVIDQFVFDSDIAFTPDNTSSSIRCDARTANGDDFHANASNDKLFLNLRDIRRIKDNWKKLLRDNLKDSAISGTVTNKTLRILAKLTNCEKTFEKIPVGNITFTGNVLPAKSSTNGIIPPFQFICTAQPLESSHRQWFHSSKLKLIIDNEIVTLEEARIKVSQDSNEGVTANGRFDLKNHSAQFQGKIALNVPRLLKKLDITLPERIIKLNRDDETSLTVTAKLSDIFDSSTWDINGRFRIGGASFLGLSLKQTTLPFEIVNASHLHIDNATIIHTVNDSDVPLLTTSVNIALKPNEDNWFEANLQDCALFIPPDNTANQPIRALSLNAAFQFNAATSKIRGSINGSSFIDRVYRWYVAKSGNRNPFWILMQMHSKNNQPTTFSLSLPETQLSLDDINNLYITGNIDFHSFGFSGYDILDLHCDKFTLSPTHCSVQNIYYKSSLNDTASFNIDVNFAPILTLTFTDILLHGDPKRIGECLDSYKARQVFQKIFGNVTLGSTHGDTEVQCPRIQYKDIDDVNWSLTTEGILLSAKDMKYKDLQLDLTSIIELNLPQDVTINPILVGIDKQYLAGNCKLTLTDNNPVINLELTPTRLGCDISKITQGLHITKLNKILDKIDISPDAQYSISGTLDLKNNVYTLAGRFNIPKVAAKRRNLYITNLEGRWQYQNNIFLCHVNKCSPLDGTGSGSISFDQNEQTGKFIAHAKDIPLKSIRQSYQTPQQQTDDDNEEDIPGTLEMETDLTYLVNWGDLPLQFTGSASVNVRKAKLWNVPILSQLGQIIVKSITLGWFSGDGLGEITQVDADLTFRGANIILNSLKTDGTILALKGEGEYNWHKDELNVAVSTIPVQNIKFLSWVMRTITGSLDAQLTGSIKNPKWEITTFLRQIF